MREADPILTPPIRENGKPVVLLASCLGPNTGGGLFAYDGGELERLDTLSTTGLTLHDGELARLLTAKGEETLGELLLYDARGIKQYQRLDFLKDVHDIAWDGEAYLVVSTGNNTVYRISRSGAILSEWKLPGEGDACHLNCLALEGEHVWISAFGLFYKNREWLQHRDDGMGLIFDLRTGRRLITGLDCPHHLRFFDGALGVCNSASAEFLHMDPANGKILRKVQLNAWTRGVALSDDFIFVGESNRASSAKERTSIAILARKTWELLGRIPVGCDEIYDLLLVPPEIADGARIGFHANALRHAEQTRRDLFQAVGLEPQASAPLPHEDCRAEILCNLPQTMPAKAVVEVECTITNRGNGTFLTTLPNPIALSYKWRGNEPENQEFFVEGNRIALPRFLGPGQSVCCEAFLAAPAIPGKYQLTVTLLQEYCVWFDDLNPANAVCGEVLVTG